MNTLLRTLILLTLGGSGLALALLAVKYLLYRKLPSTFYYYAWLLVLLRFLLPIPGMIPVREAPPRMTGAVQTVQTPPEYAPPTGGEAQTVPTALPASPAPALPDSTAPEAQPENRKSEVRLPVSLSSPALWMGIWAVGTVISLLIYVFSYSLFASEIRQHIRSPLSWDRCYPEFNKGRKPDLWLCDGIYSPMLLGLFRPMIILPEGEYDQQTIRNILRHELMHYRRLDLLYKWFSVIVFSAQWFNPITYVIRHELNRACELSCDEMIIRRMNREEKQSYGDTLLTLAANRTLPANLTATTFATEKRNLKERLVQIMKYKISAGTILAALVILGLLALCGAALGPRVMDSVQRSRTAPRNLSSHSPLFQEALSQETAHALVYEINSDTLLYAQDADGRVDPGCMIPLAVAMTVLDKCDTQEAVTISENDFYTLPRGVRHIRLKSGEVSTVGDLIYGLLLSNASDAAIALAEHTSGSVEEFLPLMNRYLQDAGCTDTSLTDLLGLAPEQHTTVRDMARLYHRALENEFLSRVFASDYYMIPPTGQSRERMVMNLSPLFQDITGYRNDRRFTGGISNDWQSRPATLVFTMETADPEPMELLFAVQLPKSSDYSRITQFRQSLPEEIISRFCLVQNADGTLSVENRSQAQLLPGADPLAGYNREDIRYVESVDAFLSAIKPGAVIYLEEGDYNLRSADRYGLQSNLYSPYYRWEEVADGFQLVIQDVENLTILGASRESTRLLAEPRYANVLRFTGCSGLEIANLTIGHTGQSGYCSGGVLSLDRCQAVHIHNNGLFGCGTTGVDAWFSSDITVGANDIYECSANGVSFSICQDVRVLENTFRDIGSTLRNTDFGQVFSLVSCSGAVIKENTVRDCQCSELLYSGSTTDLQLLSNRFESNRFASAFWVEGPAAVVDGCSFSADFRADRWFHGEGTCITDLSGNLLTVDRLIAMEYRSGLQVSPPPPAGGDHQEITVTDIDQFLAAIGSNRTILIDAKELKLSDAADYGRTGNGFYSWQSGYDGPELLISGADNLEIRSISGKPEDCRILASPRYANVLTFQNCRNISISGITAGHTDGPGSCTGGVLKFSGCWNPTVENCKLFGCGTWGIHALYSTDLTVRDCEIYECSSGGMNLSFVTGGIIEQTLFRNLDGMAIYGSDCSAIALTGCEFRDNRGSSMVLHNCTGFTQNDQNPEIFEKEYSE